MSLFDNRFSYCINCGSKIEKDGDFCCNCGTGTSKSIVKKQKQEARSKLYEITGGFIISSEFLSKTKDLSEEQREHIKKSIEEEIENSYLKHYEIEPKVDELITFYRDQKLKEEKRKKEELERLEQQRINKKIKKAKKAEERLKELGEEEYEPNQILDEAIVQRKNKDAKVKNKFDNRINNNLNRSTTKKSELYDYCKSDEFKKLSKKSKKRIKDMILCGKIKKVSTLKRIIKLHSISKTEYTDDKYNFKFKKQLEKEKIEENRKKAISKLHPYVVNLYYVLENNQRNEEIKEAVECINKNLLSKFDASEYIIDLHSKYFLKISHTGMIDWNQKMYGSEVDFYIKDYNEIASNPNRSTLELLRAIINENIYYLNKVTGYLDKRPAKFIEFIMNSKNPGVYQLIAEYGYFSSESIIYWSFVKIILNEYCGLYGDELYNKMSKLDNALKAHKLKSVFNEFELNTDLKKVLENTSKLLLMRNFHVSYFDRRKGTTIELKTDEDDHEYKFSRKNYFVIKERNKSKTPKELEEWVRYKSTTYPKIKIIVRYVISSNRSKFNTIVEVIDFIDFCENNLKYEDLSDLLVSKLYEKDRELYKLYKKSNKK